MEMSGKRWITYPSRSDVFTVHNISDIHLGHKACAEDRLAADIQQIADDPNAFWVGGGDYADYISYNDKRFVPNDLAEWLKPADLGHLGEVLTRKVRDVLWPIKHKCLGLAWGNHEWKYSNTQDQAHLHGWLCTEFGVPNFGYSALFDIVFVRVPECKQPELHWTNPTPSKKNSRASFRFFIHHGNGASRTAGGKINMLVRHMTEIQADVYMCGHVHEKIGKREITIGGDMACRNQTQKERIGIVSGSYYRSFCEGCTTYAERMGLKPTSLGPSFVRIEPDKNRITGEI